MTTRSILVTGATGFVGTALRRELTHRGLFVRKAVRAGTYPDDADCYGISDITRESAWLDALRNVDTVIHLIARTHVLDDRSADPIAAYHSINVLGTVALARQAVACGVRRAAADILKLHQGQWRIHSRRTVFRQQPPGTGRWLRPIQMGSRKRTPAHSEHIYAGNRHSSSTADLWRWRKR